MLKSSLNLKDKLRDTTQWKAAEDDFLKSLPKGARITTTLPDFYSEVVSRSASIPFVSPIKMEEILLPDDVKSGGGKPIMKLKFILNNFPLFFYVFLYVLYDFNLY
jgi:hypothetical protein